MALVDLVMPKLGESITEATILKWFKQPGDMVMQDETLLEIATDKVDSEVPSTSEGVLEEMLFHVNDIVPVGTVIARIRTKAVEHTPAESTPVPVTQPQSQSHRPQEENNAVNSSNGQRASVNTNRFYSPLVLNIAANEGISLSELENLSGTGNDGRVTKQDILRYISDKGAGRVKDNGHHHHVQEVTVLQKNEQRLPIVQEPATQVTMYSGNVEIIEMDRMRKLIADHMVRSKHTSPHVTSFTEADVTNLVQWREKTKKEFEKRENTKITFTPLFIEAIVRCIKKISFDQQFG